MNFPYIDSGYLICRDVSTWSDIDSQRFTSGTRWNDWVKRIPVSSRTTCNDKQSGNIQLLYTWWNHLWNKTFWYILKRTYFSHRMMIMPPMSTTKPVRWRMIQTQKNVHIQISRIHRKMYVHSSENVINLFYSTFKFLSIYLISKLLSFIYSSLILQSTHSLLLVHRNACIKWMLEKKFTTFLNNRRRMWFSNSSKKSTDTCKMCWYSRKTFSS